MTEWAVEMEARATTVIVVEADTEDEAEAKAKEQGFELDDYHELQDFTVLGVRPE